MIRITPLQEPEMFDMAVRQTGMTHLASLAEKSSLTNKDFEGHEYWLACHTELFIAYRGICAYYCVKLHRQNANEPFHSSVDHFKPKALCPDFAYEWSNYRLASNRANAKKRDKENILDPFCVQNRWFRLDFTTGKVCLKHISPEYRAIAQNTLQTLLNIKVMCDYRLALFEQCKKDIEKHQGNITAQQVRKQMLQQESPFVYDQAVLQNKI